MKLESLKTILEAIKSTKEKITQMDGRKKIARDCLLHDLAISAKGAGLNLVAGIVDSATLKGVNQFFALKILDSAIRSCEGSIKYLSSAPALHATQAALHCKHLNHIADAIKKCKSLVSKMQTTGIQYGTISSTYVEIANKSPFIDCYSLRQARAAACRGSAITTCWINTFIDELYELQAEERSKHEYHMQLAAGWTQDQLKTLNELGIKAVVTPGVKS